MTKDAVLDRAVDLARAAAEDVADQPDDVGEHLGATWEADRLVTHRFACAARGYRGWQWTVVVARVPRGRSATVCEAVLQPGDGALLARPWVPWAERLRPGDLGVGDVLPFRPDDPRLEPGWRPSGEPDADDAALVPVEELALARERVLAPLGRNETAARWYRGTHGPTSAGALAATAACATCGFLVPVRGVLGQVFGVCANEWSPDDGAVVSLDHGCGAHSQTDADPEPSQWPAPDPLIDDSRVDVVTVERAEPDGAVEPGATETSGETAASDEPDAKAADEPAEPVATQVDEPVEADGPASEVVPDETEPVAEIAEPTADGPEAVGGSDDGAPATVTDDAPEPVAEASADPSPEG
ncbi:MAG: DUF3027 domain-containing protein [Micrococcales bacterium]|nr:DUF3027 domain-containing protein [Micrococcales bacterium]